MTKIYTLVIGKKVYNDYTVKNFSTFEKANEYVERLRHDTLIEQPERFTNSNDEKIYYHIIENDIDSAPFTFKSLQLLYDSTWGPYMKWKAVNGDKSFLDVEIEREYHEQDFNIMKNRQINLTKDIEKLENEIKVLKSLAQQ